MSLFKTFRGNKSNLPQNINDGAIYALQDTEELYIDISEDKRVKISDIVEVENKEALPLAPLENKFYYVKDLGALYKYNGTEYLEISQSPLYIDFILDDISSDEYYTFTTTFLFEKAVEEYKKGRRVIAKLLPSENNPQGWVVRYYIDLVYSENLGIFASNLFLMQELQRGNPRNGQFIWVKNEDHITCQLNLSSCGVASFNGQDGDVVPKSGDYTPEMVGMGDGIIYENLKVQMPSKNDWDSVVYGNGKFVAVARDSSKQAAYSADGINWTETTLPTTAYWTSIAYGNGKFVAISYNSNKAAYSADGITWTQTTLPTTAYWNSIAYGNNCFVAIAGSNSNKAAYSADGITWTETNIPEGKWISVTYGNGIFVAISYNSKQAAYSTDGITWTETTLPTTTSWQSVCYGNGKFVAIVWSYSTAAYSTDGINWTRTSLPSSAYWRSVAYGNNRFVAVTDNSSNKAAYSTDGINWTQTTLPTTAYWTSIAYGNGKFVATSSESSNKVAYSPDGTTWYDSFQKKLVKPDNTDITEDIKSLVAPDAMTEEEIIELWNSIE